MLNRKYSQYEQDLRNRLMNLDTIELLNNQDKIIEILYDQLCLVTGRYNPSVSQVDNIANTLQNLDGKKRKIVESSLHDMKLYLQEITGEQYD